MSKTVIKEYTYKTDATRNIILEDLPYETYHVTEYENGQIFLEPVNLIEEKDS